MGHSNYIEHLKTRLGDIDKRIERARLALHARGVAGKADAIEMLSRLKMRHDDLAERIKEGERQGAENWSALHTSFREEADALADTLERWITKHG